MADAGYLTIGKVVKRLQPQYPDLSISKVRYLEDEGLLTPSRTPGGYRLYSARDVHRLETILYLQKTRFLPLSVIKDELEGRESRERDLVSASEEGGDAADPLLAVSPAAQQELHPIDRMPEVAGVSIAFVRHLSECGVIELVRSPHGRDLVNGRDLRLIRACEELRRYGIEPRNLRQYVTAARRESLMFEQAVGSIPRHQGESEEERRMRANQTFDRVLSLTNALRGALLRRSLKGSLDDS